MFLRLRHAMQGLPRISQWLPSSCALCGRLNRHALCQPCREHYFTRRPRRCVQCAMPIATAARAIRCGACVKLKPAFDATVVATDYLAPADQLVLALKFGNRLELAPLLAGMLGQALQYEVTRGLALPSMLTMVPLGQQRLRERGFNQSLEIARPLARQFDIRLEPQLLLRLLETRQQASLPLDQRRRNVRRAFMVPNKLMYHVRGQHVGVVDDVITTGETLNEIAVTLKRFGALRVTNIVFARTLPR